MRTISVCIANFYVSDSDVTRDCLYVRWFKIYTSVSLSLNIQNKHCLIYIHEINYRHIPHTPLKLQIGHVKMEAKGLNMSHFNSLSAMGILKTDCEYDPKIEFYKLKGSIEYELL